MKRTLFLMITSLLLTACGGNSPSSTRVLIAPGEGNTQVQGRVLIIGQDGTRSEVLEVANTPNIDSVRASGFADLDAITNDVSLSGPGWASMLAGVWCDEHGVFDNDASWNQSRFDQFPHFLHAVEQDKPELFTASVVQWNPINDEILCADERADSASCSGVDVVANFDNDIGVRDRAVELLQQEDIHMLFVQFDDNDHAGHGTAPDDPPGGFCPFSDGRNDGDCTLRGVNQDYIDRTSTTDGHIGTVLDALAARPNYENENWLILMSPDHGGAGGVFNQHGFSNPQDRRTFFIVSGAAAAPLPGTPVTTLADIPERAAVGLTAPQPVADTTGAKIVDIAATALFHLGVDIPAYMSGQAAGVVGAPAYQERSLPTCYDAGTFVPDDRIPL